MNFCLNSNHHKVQPVDEHFFTLMKHEKALKSLLMYEFIVPLVATVYAKKISGKIYKQKIKQFLLKIHHPGLCFSFMLRE